MRGAGSSLNADPRSAAVAITAIATDSGTAGDFMRFLETMRKGGAPLVSRASVDLLSTVKPRDFEVSIPGWKWAFGWPVFMLRAGIANAIALARSAISIMRQNLAWAAIYNLIGIPLAAGALYPAFHLTLAPWMAAAAMALSSVSVLGNSLRLRGWRAPVSFSTAQSR